MDQAARHQVARALRAAARALSAETQPGQRIKVPGYGPLWTESTDSDDAFPVTIKSYEDVGGHLVYTGRNGSVGIVVGTDAELRKWKRDVDKALRDFPISSPPRPWQPSDGGARNIRKATEAARRVLPGARVEFLVSEDKKVRGEHGRTPAVVNGHLDETTEVGGTKVHAGSQVAAHEAAHEAFVKNRVAGGEAMGALKKWGGSVSIYHALTSDFEGLMDAAAWWSLAPKHMQRKAPALYDAVSEWLRPR